jgi:hypothetical protein
MNTICRHLAVCCLVLIACLEARAQIAAWEIAGTSAATSNPKPASALDSFIDGASLTLGSGITASSATDTFGGSGFNSTSLASAITGNQYLSFTLTPSSGYAVSLTSLSLLSGVSTATTSFHGEVLSSATGFNSAASLHSYSFSSTTAPLQSITLSGVSALQNVTGPVEFRIYGWRDTGGTSTFRLRSLTGNDLVLNGTVSAVPEPSTYAAIIGALTLAGVILQRRRRVRH